MSNKNSYELIEKKLQQYVLLMTKARETILTEDVSKYPIFVAHQQELELGVPLVEKNNESDTWSIHMSTLEEFVQRQIISMEKIDSFRDVYRKSKGQLCIFILADVGAKFLFIPIKHKSQQ